MIARTTLSELAAIDAGGYPVISFYLNIDAYRGEEATHIIRKRNLLDRVSANRARLGSQHAASLDRDIQRIRDFVRDRAIESYRGVAIFASYGGGVWEPFVFEQLLVDHVSVGAAPDLAPLYRVLAQSTVCATALVEQGKARLFLVTREAVHEVNDIYTDVPGRHDQGGWSQARWQRHHDEHVHQHLRQTAEQLLGLYNEEGYQHLFLAGTEPLTTALRDILHPYVKARLGGTMTLPLTSTAAEVQAATLSHLDRLSEVHEEALLSELREQAATGRLGVTGLGATLAAVQRGQVATLIVGEECRSPGWYVRALDHYAVSDTDPVCQGHQLEAVDDIVGVLIERAISSGGNVVVMRSAAARAGLAPWGGVAALLRFRMPEASAIDS
jgi:peptide chain release factor subunit 1